MLKWWFYFCVFTLSLGQFSSIYKVGDSSVYLFDICLALFVVFGTAFFLIRKTFYIPKAFFFFFAFTFVALLSLLLHFDFLVFSEFSVAAMYLLRWLVYLIAALVIFNMVRNKLLSVDQVLWAFILSGLFIALAGFVQLLVLPDFETLDPSLGWDPHKNRLASTFFDPNFTGAYLTICITLVFKYIKSHRFFSITTLFILTTALFLTFSRSSWAMFAVVILVYGLFKYRWLLVLSGLLAFSAYFFVPRVQTRISGATDPADSAQFRIISWKNTWEIAKDNLLIGVGFNAFRYAQRDYGFLDIDSFYKHSGAGSDSSLLFVLATTGVLGFLFFVSGFLGVFKAFPDDRLLLFAVFGGLFIHSLFVNSLFYPQILFLWLILIAEFSYSLHK